MSQEDRERYRNACHAMQSGVSFRMHHDASETAPKHLRVGVNSALCDSAGLAKLLIAKGVFTLDEYEKAIADEMEAEVKRYKDRIEAELGRPVDLA